MRFFTGSTAGSSTGTERMRIDSSGNVGIGTSSPSNATLDVVSNGTASFQARASTAGVNDGDTTVVISRGVNSTGGKWSNAVYRGYSHAWSYGSGAGSNEAMRIDSSGNVGIGTSSTDGKLKISATSGGGNAAELTLYGNNGAVYGYSNVVRSKIASQSAGDAFGANLLFYTNDSSNVYQERMRIDSSGNVGVGTTTNPGGTSGSAPRGQWLAGANGAFVSATYQSAAAEFNRLNNDGSVVNIKQNGTTEGTISVSGTTVSYNGGHLARWSQTADNTRIDGLVKGTVMTNLDQMAVWGDEDNEQLNCMAVSSVEGDPNVAGVFVNWDNDDEDYTSDMNIAMTGDMIIRIAQGTTVARGDMLMSAGDGTAKSQGDDIVRSKTIAKVTSTHVTCTYDDGSYCVPCVLMAC
jgi:hypothetical protein